jgi:hypothetical protein
MRPAPCDACDACDAGWLLLRSLSALAEPQPRPTGAQGAGRCLGARARMQARSAGPTSPTLVKRPLAAAATLLALPAPPGRRQLLTPGPGLVRAVQPPQLLAHRAGAGAKVALLLARLTGLAAPAGARRRVAGSALWGW